MVKQYFFSSAPQPDLQLDESFAVSAGDKGARYLVSNVGSVNAEIHAREINFYLARSADGPSKKCARCKDLYAIRATAFDLAQDIDLTAEVGRKILIVSSDRQDDLCAETDADGFTAVCVDPSDVVEVAGSIGRLRIRVKNEGRADVVEADQIIWFHPPQSLSGRGGIYDPEVLGIERTVAAVQANSGTYHFRKYIKYDSSLCQYPHKRQDVCGLCVDVCETRAIAKNSSCRQLEISDINCSGCGRCVSVCPSGALDFAPIPRSAFQALRSFYTDTIALILPERIDPDRLDIHLKENVLPLVVETEEFLDECHFLSLLQTTGHPVILYTDRLSELTANIIRLINDIYQRRYARQAIFPCSDAGTLQLVFDQASPIPGSVFEIEEEGLTKREVFSARLSHVVGERDWGVVATGPYLHYGNLAIDQDRCTLCLSCAGACDTGALTAHPQDNTLRFRPSMCTGCGYCAITCPEQDCLRVLPDRLALNPLCFTQQVLARDEIFRCVECGAGFAPAKVIGKVIAVMKPIFGDDAARIRTLSCCPACKARVMLQEQVMEKRTDRI
ncbi:MAG: 4Fe-4S binding protein [Desulfocapsaceae bacterium]|nr:4Fe-4S binding protein [Desulfocapsaceae bacterium]